jgi:hypothetical protein
MATILPISVTAFAGTDRLASGTPADVAVAVRGAAGSGDPRIVLVFDDATAEPVELDIRGSVQEVRVRYSSTVDGLDAGSQAQATLHRPPGRPKLGVVGREVTLLPRHWEWLSEQPGGASVALRKLVEQARRDNGAADSVRRSQEAAFRFMSAVAGNEPGFEEATRALFAGRVEDFEARVTGWPRDVREYARTLAERSFAPRVP